MLNQAEHKPLLFEAVFNVLRQGDARELKYILGRIGLAGTASSSKNKAIGTVANQFNITVTKTLQLRLTESQPVL